MTKIVIKINNTNLDEIRSFLSKLNIKPTPELSYYLTFGFKDDKEEYEFDLNDLKTKDYL